MLFPFICLQLISLLCIFVQLYGLILLYKLNERHLQEALCKANLRKRNYFLKRLKKIKQRRLRRKKRKYWFKPGRTDQWWQNMLNGVAPQEEWKKNFRMTKESFLEMVKKLRPLIAPNPNSPNSRVVSVEKKLAVTLYYLKDTGSLCMTANVFGIAINTASNIITDTCTSIVKLLGPTYIHLPKDENEMRKKVAEFETKFGMQQAFGCIDGTHIPITSPSDNPQDYYCYKGFHSLNVQAVCDYKGTFMDAECRWPGSVHDAKAFANSSINNKLRNGELPRVFQSVLPGYEKVPNYLNGDPAYPLTPFCMKEYDTCENNEQVVFNNILRSARNPIECAFWRLKARWAVLRKKIDLKLENVPIVVYACFVLHNYCEQYSSYINEDMIASQIQHAKPNEESLNLPDPVYSCNNSVGEVVRNILTHYVRINLPDDLVI